MGKQWKQWETIFWGSKITADGDWSHETWKKSYNQPRQHIFLVVMYGCESWTIKKAECQRIDAFELWCWIRLFESPLDFKTIQSVHPKGNQSWIFIGRTDAEAEAPILGYLMQRTDSLEKAVMLGKIEGRRRRGQQRMMFGWHHQCDGHEFL